MNPTTAIARDRLRRRHLIWIGGLLAIGSSCGGKNPKGTDGSTTVAEAGDAVGGTVVLADSSTAATPDGPTSAVGEADSSSGDVPVGPGATTDGAGGSSGGARIDAGSTSGGGAGSSGGARIDAGSTSAGGAGSSGGAGIDAGNTSAGGAVGGSVDWLAVIESAKVAISQGQSAIDLNGDGTPDYYRTLSGTTVSHEEIDVDGDGLAEMVWDYSQATKTFRRDDNHDGKFEESLDVTADAAHPTIISFVEKLDENSDGTPNTVRKWTVDPSKTTVSLTVQEDTDGDGTLDWSVTSTVPLLQKKIANVPTTGTNACTADQAAKIEAALSVAVEQAMGCLSANNPSLGMKLAKFLASSNITIGCDNTTVAPNSYCGEASLSDVSAPWFGNRDSPINLNGPAFDPAACGPLSSTIFHEMLHYVNGLHQYGDGSTDPGDSVYNCEKMCFGVVAADGSSSPASNQECAACLGVKADNSQCNRFPKKPCTPAPAACPCKGGSIYPDLAKCSVGCPSGLACFTARCVERGPCRK